MFQIVGFLAFATVSADGHRTTERASHDVGVKQDLALDVASRPAGGLNEARFTAKEAFFVRIEDAD